MHLSFKPPIEHIPLEAPLAANLCCGHPTFPGELVDRHDVEPQVLRHFTEGHNLLFPVDAVFLHGLTHLSFRYRKYAIHQQKCSILLQNFNKKHTL